MKFILALFAFALLSTSANAALPAGHPPADQITKTAAPATAVQEIQLTEKGKVLNVIDVEQYTYIEVSQGNTSLWLATTKTAVKKGDMIQFVDGTAMTNFYSKTLKRTFPSIKFVGKVVVANRGK